MEGWVKLHRVIQEKPVWTGGTDFQKVLLVVILLNVNHKAKEWEWKGQRYEVQPGQMVTSLASLVKLVGKGATVQKVRGGLARLVKYGFLKNESTRQNRLLTVLNWESYQGKLGKENLEEERMSTEMNEDQMINDSGKYTDKREGEASKFKGWGLVGNKQLTDDQQTDNKQVTKDQQTANRRITTNKNDKNEKKGRSLSTGFSSSKDLYGEFVRLTPTEHEKLLVAYGAAGTRRMIELLDHYKGSSGKKYQSDYRAILSWVVGRWQEEVRKGQGENQKAAAGLSGLSDIERLARGESLEEVMGGFTVGARL